MKQHVLFLPYLMDQMDLASLGDLGEVFEVLKAKIEKIKDINEQTMVEAWDESCADWISYY